MNTRSVLLSCVLVALVLGWGAPALACSVCGCGDPLLAASDPAAVNGRMRLQLETEYLTVEAVNEESPKLTDKLDQYTIRLNTVYSPVERLSVIGVLLWTRKNLQANATSDVSGIGDAEIGARYASSIS